MNVIMTADDFGKSGETNQAIQQAFQYGNLTETSLMVSGEAVTDAVTFARENPGLSIGLHLVLSDGQSVLPKEKIPHLVDKDGYFSTNASIAGIKYFFSRQCHHELNLEIQAQFEKFAETGLAMSHVDGHQHLHIHPTIFKMILPLAEKYGARGIRIPHDDLFASLRFCRRGLGLKLAWRIIFGLLSSWCSRQLNRSTLLKTERVYGVLQSGNMREDYVVYLLQHINRPAIELYFHPALDGKQIKYGANRGDLNSLMSPHVKQALHEANIHLIGYSGLQEPKGET